MGVEIEAKMKVTEFEPLRRRLREQGALPLGRTLETNIFFDTEDARLKAADSGLRVRTNRDIGSGSESYVITYKGPVAPGALKSREEIELTVDNPSRTAELFAKLGFLKRLSFQKRRETWKLGQCKVELDEVPHMGLFVEVEGPDERQVLEIRNQLGLDNEPMIKTGYASMLLKYLRENDMTSKDVTFAAE